MAKENNQKNTWIKPRHRVVTRIAAVLMRPYCRWKYGITIDQFKEQGDRAYMVLMNHQTPFDQFFLGLAFKGAIYYFATEDIFSKGWISSLLRYLVAPISIKKQTIDITAMKNCFKIVKEGGTVAMAPEGNRTYSGRTEYINPSIVPLVKKLKLPVALFRIEGGYGVQPRWSDVVRKGKMRGYVSQVIEPEAYKEMSDEQLFQVIKDGLYVNEACVDGVFQHKKLAEYLERAIYVCPYCGLSTFESHDDVVCCNRCNRKVRYLPTKELEGIGFDFLFRFVADWYDYQCDFVNKLDVREYLEQPLYVEKAGLWEVIVRKKKVLLEKEAILSLYGDRVLIVKQDGNECEFLFSELSAVTVLGRNKLNLYHNQKVYQIKGSKRFNALKYVNIYHRYKNMNKEDGNGTFLGL